MLLEGKVALVTGSGRGLGRACARIFAREGASVVVADLNASDGDETVRSIGDAGGQALFVQADGDQAADIERMVAAAETNFGGLDCAINNAVRNIGRTPLADITEEVWLAAAAGRSSHRLGQ